MEVIKLGTRLLPPYWLVVPGVDPSGDGGQIYTSAADA